MRTHWTQSQARDGWRPTCRRGSGKSIRYDADHDQDRSREGNKVHVLRAPFNQPSNAYGSTAVVVNIGASSSGRTQPPP